MRYRQNSNVQGFIKGAYAGAIGTILGACVLLGKIAIGDWLTALVALVSLVVLFRWKVSNPLLVAAAAIVGLIAFPLLKPEWVFVKSTLNPHLGAPLGSVGTVVKLAGSGPVRESRNATTSPTSRSVSVRPSCTRPMIRTASASVATEPS